VPDPAKLKALVKAVESIPFPAEGSDDATWQALAVAAAAKAEFEVDPDVIERAFRELHRRCETLPVLAPADWSVDRPESSYLRLLASYETSAARRADLASALEIRTRLRAGQSLESGACREGSWDPPPGGSRLAVTVLHLLALESLPGYGFRGGHPLRIRLEDEDPVVKAFLERRRREAARLAERLREAPDALRRGIARVREAWRAQPGADLGDAVAAAFDPVPLSYVRHVRKVEVGDHLESDNGEEFAKFKPLTRLGGKRDLLTPEVHGLLSEGGGVAGVTTDWVFVAPDADDDLRRYGKTLIFTLPDGPAWSSYVVVGFAELPEK
jgi:hypothetical protein